MNNQPIKKPATLLIGATSGIGRELARICAKNGHTLILVARDQADLEEIGAELKAYGQQVTTIPCDLSKDNAAAALYTDITGQGFEIECLINDAGFGEYGKFYETDWAKEQGMVHLNILALTQLCKLCLPDMLRLGRGKILNLASVAGFNGIPYLAVYSATKAYVLHFSEALATELEGTGVTVTALCPGATDTNFFNVADMTESKVAQGDLADPADVAQMGYDAMIDGKRVVIHGLMNNAMVESGRLLPREWVVERLEKMHEPVGADK